jgi:DNA recombination protein RmuC
MQLTYVVLIAIVAAVVAALLVVVLARRRWLIWPAADVTNERLPGLEADLLAVREAKAGLERRLAVEEERSSRIPGIESALAERTGQVESLRQEKTAVETQLATSTEGLVRVEAALQDVSARLTLAEQAHAQIGTRLETAVREKGDLESTIAEKSALLTGKTETATKLDEQLKHTTLALEAAKKEIADLGARLATLQETLDQERKQAGEKLALLTEAKEQMTGQFKLLADDVMKLHGENFSKQNKEQIDAVLTPLREKLGEFQLGLQTAHTESAKERATLGEQIRQLSESSAKMSTETHNLTRALKGEAQTQGAWGEMILGSILERSGLREGEEYVVQQSHATDEGQRLRPDVVVNLPGGQRIVIDSKVSLVAFEAHVNAETDAERAATLSRHVTSMRSHIRELTRKEYHSAAGSQLDYVMMFIPIEGALAVALQAEPNLTAFAVENNVAIATPTTLMIALRTVANVWQVERRNRNAEAIAARAGQLYDKLVGFVEDMAVLGNRLIQARTSYDDAMGKLSSGRGNLVRQVEQLKVLGAKTVKSLPAALLDDGDVETLPAAETTELQALGSDSASI